MTDAPPRDEQASAPWWRHGMVWLVIGGPAAVVVAGIATAVIAISGADTPIDRNATAAPRADAQAPAVQARNHAATPRP